MADDDGGPLNFRREFVDASLPTEDLLGRKQPRRLGLSALAPILMTAGMRPQRIPDEYWSLDVNAEGFSVAIVACPCGMTPSIEAGAPVVPCHIYEGDLRSWDPEADPLECNRAYSFTGMAVFVWNAQRPVNI